MNASARIGDPDGKWQLALIGRHLTKKYHLLFASDRTGSTSVPLPHGEQGGVPARGREVTVQSSFRFWGGAAQEKPYGPTFIHRMRSRRAKAHPWF